MNFGIAGMMQNRSKFIFAEWTGSLGANHPHTISVIIHSTPSKIVETLDLLLKGKGM